jgi:hypothetical protein
MDFERCLALLRALERHVVDYILIGGIALNFLRPDVQNVERLWSAPRSVWNDPDIEQITALTI